MHLWETKELGVKELFAASLEVSFQNALGVKIVLLLICSSLILAKLSDFVVFLLFFPHALLVPYIIHQAISANRSFLKSILTFFKDFWARCLFFIIVVLAVYGSVLYLLQEGVNIFVETYLPPTNATTVASVGRTLTLAVVLVPFFFTAFSVAIKDLPVLKATYYSFVLMKSNWRKVLYMQALLVPPLLFTAYAPSLASAYFGSAIDVYFFIVLIIFFYNLDFLRSHPEGLKLVYTTEGEIQEDVDKRPRSWF